MTIQMTRLARAKASADIERNLLRFAECGKIPFRRASREHWPG
jgi:hypothetical protein